MAPRAPVYVVYGSEDGIVGAYGAATRAVEKALEYCRGEVRGIIAYGDEIVERPPDKAGLATLRKHVRSHVGGVTGQVECGYGIAEIYTLDIE